MESNGFGNGLHGGPAETDVSEKETERIPTAARTEPGADGADHAGLVISLIHMARTAQAKGLR